MTDIRTKLFIEEIKQAQEMLNNDFVCPKCKSERVAQVSLYICHCRNCDKWFCREK